MYGVPLKYLGLALAALTLVTAATLWFNSRLDQAFANGEAAQVERVNKITAENNRLNRLLEEAAQSGLDEAVEELKRANEALDRRTEKQIDTVRTVIERNPELEDCEIPQAIIDAKNEIREAVQ